MEFKKKRESLDAETKRSLRDSLKGLKDNMSRMDAA